MNVVALLAHPDDEVICAGTLARLAANNAVRLLTLFMDERESEWEACAKTLDVTAEHSRGGEDDFAWSRRWVRDLDPWIGRPDLLISHRAEDPNTSHGHIGRIARTLARKNRTDLWELDQTMAGGINPDAPNPNHFVDISAFADRKYAAIECYPSQLARYPGWLGALKARDSLYGWQIGTEAAEAFRIVKSVWL